MKVTVSWKFSLIWPQDLLPCVHGKLDCIGFVWSCFFKSLWYEQYCQLGNFAPKLGDFPTIHSNFFCLKRQIELIFLDLLGTLRGIISVCFQGAKARIIPSQFSFLATSRSCLENLPHAKLVSQVVITSSCVPVAAAGGQHAKRRPSQFCFWVANELKSSSILSQLNKPLNLTLIAVVTDLTLTSRI